MSNKKLTPLLKQYLKIKNEHKDCLIFFRLGDFYELFFDDALKASKELNILLTRRGSIDGEDIPMCGVPYHQGENYLSKLLKGGFKVAICEQMEKNKNNKTASSREIIERKVVRIATPGTLTEEKELNGPENNFLASLIIDNSTKIISWVDITTGEVRIKSCENNADLNAIISTINPSEIIYNKEEKDNSNNVLKYIYSFLSKTSISFLNQEYFDYNNCKNIVLKAYEKNEKFEIANFSNKQILSIGSLLKYIYYTQNEKLPPFLVPKQNTLEDFLEIDSSSQKNLEIIKTMDGEKRGSLFHSVDFTRTSSGKRTLANDLLFPLTNIKNINIRLDLVDFFYQNFNVLNKETINLFGKIPDVSRSVSRLSLSRGGPRDLCNILVGLKNIEIFFEKIDLLLLNKPDIKTLVELIHPVRKNKQLKNIVNIFGKALEENAPVFSREGNFIKKGFNDELDSIKAYADNRKKIILEIEKKERINTGIKNLKIKYNNFLGYFIDVTPLNQKYIKDNPKKYIHRQSLKNSYRVTTEELIEISENILTSNYQSLEIETKIYKELVDIVINSSNLIFAVSKIVSRLDVAFSWATYARNYKAVRPLINASMDYSVLGGRHPSVEKTHEETFIANDCIQFNKKGNVFKLITGPNMSGKSTYLRQNALILIIAQAGGYCPAEKATIGICDKLFCRVGSGDELAKGNSTFMVEMIETAKILNEATIKSFVILDEIGRGTSTYDGMSIAWATIEYLIDIKRCKVLFASHYNELSKLADKYTNLELFTFKVKEWKGTLVFLHEIIKGVAKSSYGIQVAKMAGVPDKVINSAKENLLKIIEQNSFSKELKQISINYSPRDKHKKHNDLYETEKNTIIETIQNLNLDEISPIEAMQKLYDIKDTLKKFKNSNKNEY